MYIEDEELRTIYQTVTPERLQKLEAALLHLEKQPKDTAALEGFLREAHTLKGDSRMLGVNDVETLIHQMEDCMVEIKQGKKNFTTDLCDRLYHGLDAVRKLVHEAVTGEASGINTFLVLAQLMGAEGNGHSQKQDSSAAQIQIESSVAVAQELNPFDDLFESFEPAVKPQKSAVATDNSQSTTQKRRSSDSIDTVRVDSDKLDGLMRQAGELSITKLRVARRPIEIEEILKLYEDWSRDTFVNRAKLKQLENKVDNEYLKPIQDFWKRTEQRLEKLGDLASRLKLDTTEDTTNLESIANELESGIQNLRLLPLSTLFNPFIRMVRDLAKHQGKEINLVIEGGETRADKRIVEEMKDPLLHIIRNAIDHGIETPEEREKAGKSRTATILLRGYQSGSSIGIEIADDGRGLNLESIKRTALRHKICNEEELAKMSADRINTLIFMPGFSTRTEVTELSGRGVGLDVVRANVERLKGSIAVESSPGKGCQFHLLVSANLAITPVLTVQVAQNPYAIPVEFVETMLLVSRQEIFAIEGSGTISFQGEPISVVWLADLLELRFNAPSSATAIYNAAKTLPCIILKFGNERLGVLVNAALDRTDIFLKPQSKLLKRVRNISGATILGNGEVCMVVNPQDLFESVQRGNGAVVERESEQTKTKNKLLLVEDSIIIRTQMKRLLEGAGYEITIAVDGLEGFNKLRSGNFDAVVSDVEMPNLTGLELTAKIRQYREYSELPIILVTTLASEADKRRGAEAGANAYLTKGDFDQKVLIETLKRLI
jgi:two-component system chemotaxis sensor kinase CheA